MTTKIIPSYQWHSVETPTVFREYRLPVEDDDWKPEHHRQYAELIRLAARHGATILATNYRRG